MKERYQLLHNRVEIHQAIGRMASEITATHDGEHPLFVALLRGANPFASQLLFEMTRQAPDFHPELDYMTTSRYGDSVTPDSDQPQIIMDLSPSTDVKNRTVVILDDVLDMGNTAIFVRDHLLENFGARFVELAVLVEKQSEFVPNIIADYVGFRTPNQWLVGMGMDDSSIAKEAYRWREGIWSVTPGDTPDLPPRSALIDA